MKLIIEEFAAESNQLIVNKNLTNILNHLIVEHKNEDNVVYTFLDISTGASKQVINITDSFITTEDYGDMDKVSFLNLCAWQFS